MTETELRRRVFDARVSMEHQTGKAQRPTAIVIHPGDWHGVAGSGTYPTVVAFGATNEFMGIPVALDSQRDRGSVALAWVLEV